MPPNQIRRCGHCRLEGHNISNCTKYDIDVALNIIGRGDEYYKSYLYRNIRISKVSFTRLAQLKMMIEGLVPYIIWTNYNSLGNIYIIRFENNMLTYTMEEANDEIELRTRSAILSNIETCKIYEQEFRNRHQYFIQGCRYLYDLGINDIVIIPRSYKYLGINDIVTILTGDYVLFTERIANEQRREMRRRQEEINRRRLEAQNRQAQNNALLNREHLPIIRNTIIKADNCPICLDSLTETNNVVLRCGHQLCLPCLLSQTLIGNQSRSVNRWNCSVCRTQYL